MAAPGHPALPMSLALVGLKSPESLRQQVEWAAARGFRAVQLNAAAADARPRDLGRSARRDIAALLRRNELTLSGVDLWIPVSHYLDPAHADHAVTTACQAIDFAADLAQLTTGRAALSLLLPADRALSAGLLQTLADRCQRAGARIADHTWPAAPEFHDNDPIGVGIDPATILLAGDAPETALAQMGPRLVSARLSDISAAGRVTPGEGGLDLLEYSVAASTIPAALPLVVDLRGLADQQRAVGALVSAPGRL